MVDERPVLAAVVHGEGGVEDVVRGCFEVERVKGRGLFEARAVDGAAAVGGAANVYHGVVDAVRPVHTAIAFHPLEIWRRRLGCDAATLAVLSRFLPCGKVAGVCWVYWPWGLGVRWEDAFLSEGVIVLLC